MNVIVCNSGDRCVILCQHSNTLIIDRDSSYANRIVEDVLTEIISPKQHKDKNTQASESNGQQRSFNSKGTQTLTKFEEDINKPSKADKTYQTETQDQELTSSDADNSSSVSLTDNHASVGKKKKQKEENSDSFEDNFPWCKKEENCRYFGYEIIGV